MPGTRLFEDDESPAGNASSPESNESSESELPLEASDKDDVESSDDTQVSASDVSDDDFVVDDDAYGEGGRCVAKKNAKAKAKGQAKTKAKARAKTKARVRKSTVKTGAAGYKAEEYIKLNDEQRLKWLVKEYDELAKRGKQVTAIASQILHSIQPHGPTGEVGPPALPIPLGFRCENKAQLRLLGLHGSPMTGIDASRVSNLSTSIVLSGGYEDCPDWGTRLILVGEGSLECKKHQELNHRNMGLALAWKFGTPVRVIRGHKAFSRFGPPWGYRYDGLYFVTAVKCEMNSDNVRLYKFTFRSQESQYTIPVSPLEGGRKKHSAAAAEIPRGYVFHKSPALHKNIDAHVARHVGVQQNVVAVRPRVWDLPVHVPGVGCVYHVHYGALMTFNDACEEVCEALEKRVEREKNDVSPQVKAWVEFQRRVKWMSEGMTKKQIELRLESIKNDDGWNLAQTVDVKKPEPKGGRTLHSFFTSKKEAKTDSNDGETEWTPGSVGGEEAEDASYLPWVKFGFLPFKLQFNYFKPWCKEPSSTYALPIAKNLVQRPIADVLVQQDRVLPNNTVEPSVGDEMPSVRGLLLLEPPFPDTFDPTFDLTQGRERIRIPCENKIDSELPPIDFTYIATQFSTRPINFMGIKQRKCDGCLHGVKEEVCRAVRILSTRLLCSNEQLECADEYKYCKENVEQQEDEKQNETEEEEEEQKVDGQQSEDVDMEAKLRQNDIDDVPNGGVASSCFSSSRHGEVEELPLNYEWMEDEVEEQKREKERKSKAIEDKQLFEDNEGETMDQLIKRTQDKATLLQRKGLVKEAQRTLERVRLKLVVQRGRWVGVQSLDDASVMFCVGNGVEASPADRRTTKRQRKALVECSDLCPCDPRTCVNRHWKPSIDWRLKLQRRKTSKGNVWQLVADEPIPANVFVMHLAGVFSSLQEASMRREVQQASKRAVVPPNVLCEQRARLDNDEQRYFTVDNKRYPAIDSNIFSNCARFLPFSGQGNLDLVVLWQGSCYLRPCYFTKKAICEGEPLVVQL